MAFMTFHSVGNFMIPIDALTNSYFFFRRVGIPPTILTHFNHVFFTTSCIGPSFPSGEEEGYGDEFWVDSSRLVLPGCSSVVVKYVGHGLIDRCAENQVAICIRFGHWNWWIELIEEIEVRSSNGKARSHLHVHLWQTQEHICVCRWLSHVHLLVYQRICELVSTDKNDLLRRDPEQYRTVSMMACGIWAWFGHIVQGSHHEVKVLTRNNMMIMMSQSSWSGLFYKCSSWFLKW